MPLLRPSLMLQSEMAAHHPSSEPLSSTTVAGFKITTRKRPILKAKPIEEMEAKLRITVPEMIFGDNMILIEHVASGWSINFNTFDALDRVDKVGKSMLQVAHSKEWQDSRYLDQRIRAYRAMPDSL